MFTYLADVELDTIVGGGGYGGGHKMQQPALQITTLNVSSESKSFSYSQSSSSLQFFNLQVGKTNASPVSITL